jgi:hypothetical protein
MVPIAEIERFLKDFKFKLDFWGVIFSNRLDRKNFQTLTDLEFQLEHVKTALRELAPENYSQGPVNDTLYKGPHMWIFGKEIKKREVYVKITMGQPNDKVICISFHFAEHPMSYPYKKHSQ